MRRCLFAFDEYTFGSILKGVAAASVSVSAAFKGCLFAGQQVHSNVVKTGYHDNVYSSSAVLDMYAKCGGVDDAHKCFQFMTIRNTVSWNALIAGYAETRDHLNSFKLFNRMHEEGVGLDDGTFAPLLTLLDNPEFYKLAMQLYGKIIKLVEAMPYSNLMQWCGKLCWVHVGCVVTLNWQLMWQVGC